MFLHWKFRPKIGGFGADAIINENGEKITNEEFTRDVR